MRGFISIYKPSTWNRIQWLCFATITGIVGAEIYVGQYWDALYHAGTFIVAAEVGRRS